jgi:hypothetical protein
VEFAPHERLRFVDAVILRNAAMDRVVVRLGELEIGLGGNQLHILGFHGARQRRRQRQAAKTLADVVLQSGDELFVDFDALRARVLSVEPRGVFEARLRRERDGAKPFAIRAEALENRCGDVGSVGARRRRNLRDHGPSLRE